MSFIILPVNYDTDLEQIATIDSASSASSAKGLVDVIFPPVRSTKTSEKGLIKSTVSRLSSDGHNSSTKLIKLVDTGLAENAETNPRAIIAYARWRFYTSNTLNEIKYLMREDLPAYFGAGCDPEAVKDCFGTIWQARERLYRRTEYAHLSELCCDPQHQKRGAGSMLMKWVCNKANSLGLMIYLEGPPSGLALYLKFGFDKIEELQFDTSKYGGAENGHVTRGHGEKAAWLRRTRSRDRKKIPSDILR